MTETLPSILIVDDDDVFRMRLGRAFEARGFEVRLAASRDSARAAAENESPELAVVDLRMPGGSGLDLVSDLAAIDATTRTVVLTGFGSIATALDAVKRGAVHYLTKPATVDEILAAFEGPRGPEPGAVESNSEARPRPETVPSLARVEWEHINRVLAECDGNISQAARLLGIHRRSLQRKLAKHPTRR
jgi:two-component system response regulator RegA